MQMDIKYYLTIVCLRIKYFMMSNYSWFSYEHSRKVEILKSYRNFYRTRKTFISKTMKAKLSKVLIKSMSI